MALLRITMQGIALVINRPTTSLIVFPAIKHKLSITGPFAPKQVLLPSDIRLADEQGLLRDRPTLRPSSEYVAHLDHVTGRPVKLPDTLTGDSCPASLNARFFLNGGQLTGLPANAHRGLLRDVEWTFNESGYIHKQKLTDTVVFTRELPAGRYKLLLSSGGEEELALDLTTGRVVDVTFDNEDECPDPPLPDFKLLEPPVLFRVAGLSNFTPTIDGEASAGVRRGGSVHTKRNEGEDPDPTGSVCDDICPWFQAEG